MSTDVVMPQLGNEITEAQIDNWSKSPGDKVEKGEMLLTITTPKLTMEIEAPVSGTLREIRVAADEIASVGDVLAVIDEA
ncbi:MAG: biotin-binding protein [Aestuariivirga sp.]|uniref:lipoyl domain-containing protein n=1 Tax=Aestuariivirga sp. TaxID=2650926 RepID=UPI0025BBAE21|nr:lipoyl domain-containing protein [Aestuariivirga sp.]MCA3559561.1 biotin-binding protein [Aestuariivirga sp.]